MKSDNLLDTTHLRKCCGEAPVFHEFTSMGLYAIECRVNGHIHNTGLHETKEAAIEWWNSGKPTPEKREAKT